MLQTCLRRSIPHLRSPPLHKRVERTAKAVQRVRQANMARNEAMDLHQPGMEAFLQHNHQLRSRYYALQRCHKRRRQQACLGSFRQGLCETLDSTTIDTITHSLRTTTRSKIYRHLCLNSTDPRTCILTLQCLPGNSPNVCPILLWTQDGSPILSIHHRTPLRRLRGLIHQLTRGTRWLYQQTPYHRGVELPSSSVTLIQRRFPSTHG